MTFKIIGTDIFCFYIKSFWLVQLAEQNGVFVLAIFINF